MLNQILPFATQIAQYLKMGMDHYAALKMAGQVAGPDMVALYLQEKMVKWNPKVGETAILDEETKKAGARFLAGVAINLTGA